MKKLQKDEKGFGVVGLLLILASLVIVAGLGWLAWQRTVTEEDEQPAPETAQEIVQPEVIKTGNFKDVGEKTGSGTVSLVRDSDGTYTVRLEDDFKVQDGPALYVAFGNGETFAEGTDFAPLKQFTGTQEYKVPSNISVDRYSSVIIWCEEFAVAFASAELK